MRRPAFKLTRSTGRGRCLTVCAECWLIAAALLLGYGTAAELLIGTAAGQQAISPLAPEPIYWKQNLFLIPYQWSSAADPAAAQAVWLFVSKDNGATWQKISEAKPHVKAFNYHAEADGAYAFAIRTIDATGRSLPEGPHRPELVVVVDTTIPRIEELAGYLRADGTLDLRWRASDGNLDPATWKIEVQTDTGSAWLPVPLAGVETIGQTSWQPPAGCRPLALRATVLDRAGNSAVYQAALSATPISDLTVQERGRESFATGNLDEWQYSPVAKDSRSLLHSGGTSGWVSGSAAASSSVGTEQTANASAAASTQPWPAGAQAQVPFHLAEAANDLPTDAVTTYGRPAGNGEPLNQVVPPAQAQANVDPWTSGAAQPAAVVPSSPPEDSNRYAMADSPSRPPFRPLEPFRQTSLSGAGREQGAESAENDQARMTNDEGEAAQHSSATIHNPSPPAAYSVPPALPPTAEPKQVGSRTFALEYELAELGQWGARRIELWGTRDGGQSWQRFAEDEDHRSPLYVTVDSAGLYGFRIVVEAAGGPAADVPRTGDEPELWVAVDLSRPHAELVSISPGDGNLADHLVLRWHAADDNLQSRPIGLFYSSRPAGPWSAIATGLENTGEYAWRVERFVPSRVYLRLEARDKAGNLAAYQTADAVAIEPPQPAGVLRGVQPVGPTATGADAAYR